MKIKFKTGFLRWLRPCIRIIKFSARRYVADQLGQQAIVLTYYTLFSIVPMVALIFGITRGFGLDFSLRDFLIERFAAHKEMLNYVCDLAEWTLKESSGGIVTGVGVIALFWTVVWLIHNIENAFSVVWGLPPRRSVLRKFSNYLSVMLITPIMMVAISTLGVMIRKRMDEFAGSDAGGAFSQWLIEAAVNIAPFLANFLLFLFVYMRVPNTKVRLKGACVAAIVTGICFQILQDSFIFMQAKVFSYNRLYGGFAVLPLFLIWANWSWQLILFGAEISFVHQHLRSGIFNEGGRKVSLRLRREHQLAILRLVFRSFEDGSGPVPEGEIASELHVPEVFMRSEIGELINAGMLCRTVSPQGVALLLPGMPPEKLTVMDFLREMSGSGDDESPDFSRFEKLFSKMEKSIEESNLNAKIYEV